MNSTLPASNEDLALLIKRKKKRRQRKCAPCFFACKYSEIILLLSYNNDKNNYIYIYIYIYIYMMMTTIYGHMVAVFTTNITAKTF